jgi:hypothetical protein
MEAKLVIFFNVPEARDCLVKNERVYTLRRPRRTGHDLAAYGSRFKWKRIGHVNVEYIKRIEEGKEHEQLKPYLPLSDFETVDAWISKARSDAKTLYKVTILPHWAEPQSRVKACPESVSGS